MKDNYLFTKEIQSLVAKAGCKLKVCFGYINRGDRWMQVGGLRKLGKPFPAGAPGGISSLPQDEIELGYTQAPHKSFPVVLDSPRERGMEQLPVKELLVREGSESRPAHVPISQILLALGSVHGIIAWEMRAERLRMEIPSHPAPASRPHPSSNLPQPQPSGSPLTRGQEELVSLGVKGSSRALGWDFCPSSIPGWEAAFSFPPLCLGISGSFQAGEGREEAEGQFSSSEENVMQPAPRTSLWAPWLRKRARTSLRWGVLGKPSMGKKLDWAIPWKFPHGRRAGHPRQPRSRRPQLPAGHWSSASPGRNGR